MQDRFPSDTASKPFGPALGAFAVTPHATNALPSRPIYLLCTAAGNLRMIFANGDDVTIPVVVGQQIDARPIRIVSPETTASVTAFW